MARRPGFVTTTNTLTEPWTEVWELLCRRSAAPSPWEVAALLTALIFAEKIFPLGPRIAQFAALALILYGALVIFVPAALPLS